MTPQNKLIVKTYSGNQAEATAAFQDDSAKMASQGYFPTSQSWAPGSYGCGSFLFAFLLCFLLIGILVFIYMILVKPKGILTVTYELRAAPISEETNRLEEEKTCPRCAERIKAKALVCRFCGHEFTA